MKPQPPNARLEKGYLVLPPSYTSQNSHFQLKIPLKPRFLSPHPYTNQNIVAIARGPIIYCLEDADNSWVDDHFKSLALDTKVKITEKEVVESGIGEPYVAITATEGAYFVEISDEESVAPGFETRYVQREGVGKLNFVPYALRDNRGGKGQMRVGLRKKP